MQKYSKLVLRYKIPVPRDGYIDFKSRKKTYGVYHLKLYAEANPILDLVSRSSQSLFRYLTTIMNDNNIVFSNASIRQAFMAYIYEVHKKELYTEGTIKGSFVELKRSGLLIEKARGAFYINPLYAWRGDEASRVKAVQDIFKDNYNNLKVTLEN